ncbi:MAG: class I SAM-dependent methyltransferase [Ilumatobacteraceae bacterium]|jgi:SAM-dependent methyltransferase|nr:class I SAM-dependent methyltransferase [Ilumatobacteraceae bacterium]
MTDQYVLWKNWQGLDFGHFEIEDSLNFRHELNASGIDTVQGLRVGELGYGNGVFAGWVTAEGGDWVGREAILELQQRAAHAGFQVIAAQDAFTKIHGHEGFDLIVAFDVFEHLELSEIRLFLSEARSALRPGGHLLARFPSGDSPFSGAIYWGDATHRTLLGSSAVRQLALEAGLEICQVRSPILPVWGLGLRRAARRTAIRLIQVLVFPFIRHAFIGRGDAIITPNMVIVLKKMGQQALTAYHSPD